MKKVEMLLICTLMFVAQLGAKTDSEIADLKRRGRLGDSHAQTELGHCYEYGNGVEQSYVEAVKLYKMAGQVGKRASEITAQF